MKHQRYVLSASQAKEIYGLKFLASTSAAVPAALGKLDQISYCILIATKYGVSSKTIRDIWNRKTWLCATQELFDQEQESPINLSCFEGMDLQVRMASIAPVSLCTWANRPVAEWVAAATEQGWPPQRIAEQIAQSKENGEGNPIVTDECS